MFLNYDPRARGNNHAAKFAARPQPSQSQNEVRATACNAVLSISARQPPLSSAHLKCTRATSPVSGKDMCPALPAPTSRQLVPVNLVSAFGKNDT